MLLLDNTKLIRHNFKTPRHSHAELKKEIVICLRCILKFRITTIYNFAVIRQ